MNIVRSLPKSLPTPHRDFLDRAVETLSRESWLVGIGATGSAATDTMDSFSDLDFVLAVEEDAYPMVMANRESIARSLGPLLSGFSGEHVGLSRLFICLYGPPLLHVDFMFDTLEDVARRTDEVRVLWEREGRLSAALENRATAYFAPDPQWIEDRFWVWVHKGAEKIGRGELFEAHNYIDFFRTRVLGPLGLSAAGQAPYGVRQIEFAAPEVAKAMESSVASYDGRSCLQAFRACIAMYRELRLEEGVLLKYRREAEAAVTDFLKEIESRL